MKRTLPLLLLILTLPIALTTDAPASILGEENITLAKQLAELMEIHDELTVVSDGVLVAADAGQNLYELYGAAQAGFDEIARYSTDEFLRDFSTDVYHHYPGLQILAEGPGSERLRRWSRSRPRSPFQTYELLSAMFADATDPLKPQDRAELWRFEAAGALSLAADAEAWTQSADETARALAELADDPDLNPGKAQIVSARALSLLAVQNSHVIRLLSRRVRTDGVERAFQYGRQLESARVNARMTEDLRSFVELASKPPRLMQFDRPF